jgi:hypothetical protein
MGSVFGDDGDDTLIDGDDDIIIDADGADIILKDGGAEFGRLKRDSSHFVIKSATSDKDLIFRGNDGGSTITALTLDMSEAGDATFNSDIVVGNDLSLISDSSVLKFGADSDTTLTHTDGTGLTLNSTNKLCFGDTATHVNQSTDGTLALAGDTSIDLVSSRVNLTAEVINLGEDDTSDVTVTFKGSNNDGVLTWDESADEFIFDDSIKINKPAQSTDFGLAAMSGGTGADNTAILNLSGSPSRRGTITITLAEQVTASGASMIPTIFVSSSLIKSTDVVIATAGVANISSTPTTKQLLCFCSNVLDGGFWITVSNMYAGSAWGADGDTLVVNWVAM